MRYIYLLHFSDPISPDHTCQHYLGSTEDLAARMQAHSLGNGARLVEVAAERGIGFKVARVWRGPRELKRHKNSPALCPICSEAPRPAAYEGVDELTPDEISDLLIPF